MATFKITSSASKTSLFVEAQDSLQAGQIAQNEYGVIPKDIQLIKQKEAKRKKPKKQKLSFKEVLYIFQEMYILITSGISLKDALHEVIKLTSKAHVRFCLEQIVAGLNQGKKFSSLMASYYDKKSIVVSILKVGEKSGEFDKILDVIISHLEDRNKNTANVIKALSYPLVLIFFTFVALVVLLSVVVPQFTDIFKSFGHELPIYTQILMQTSEFLIDYGLYAVTAFAMLVVAVFLQYQVSQSTRYVLDKIVMCHIPIISKTLTLDALCKITSSLHILLYASVNVVDALQTIKEGMTNAYLKTKLDKAIQSIKSGKTLANALKEAQLLKSSDIRLVFAGENTGQTPQMLERISGKYRQDLNGYIDTIAKLIEPFLLVFISGVVLFIALSIFMPIWSLSANV